MTRTICGPSGTEWQVCASSHRPQRSPAKKEKIGLNVLAFVAEKAHDLLPTYVDRTSDCVLGIIMVL